MVLAVAFDLDVLEEHDVVVALNVLEDAAQFLGRIGAVALEPVAIGIDDALGSVDDAFAAGIVAGPGDEGADSIHGLLAGRPLDGFKIKTGRADQGSLAGGSIHRGGGLSWAELRQSACRSGITRATRFHEAGSRGFADY